MQLDVVSTSERVGGTLQLLLRRLASVAAGLVIGALVVGAATFATGWWVFSGSHAAWAVVGGVLCAIAPLAALIAWAFVRAAAHYAPRLVADIRSLLGTSSPAATTLIDYDSGQSITTTARTFSSVKADLYARRGDLPALWVGIRAITTAPKLAGVAVLATMLSGALGTVLLIAGLLK